MVGFAIVSVCKNLKKFETPCFIFVVSSKEDTIHIQVDLKRYICIWKSVESLLNKVENFGYYCSL